ncbi:MAG: hypothetical protein ACHQ01_01705 [Candidatus Limnocylindrales bacterium]
MAEVTGPLSHEERGRLGAVRRWGPGPRTVRLDSLDSAERNAVLTLVRLFGHKETAPSVSETSPGAVEIGGTINAADPS